MTEETKTEFTEARIESDNLEDHITQIIQAAKEEGKIPESGIFIGFVMDESLLATSQVVTKNIEGEDRIGVEYDTNDKNTFAGFAGFAMKDPHNTTLMGSAGGAKVMKNFINIIGAALLSELTPAIVAKYQLSQIQSKAS